MNRRNQTRPKKALEEQVVQKFPQGCPYCDQPISYDRFHLKAGENEIRCPACDQTYIKVVSEPVRNNPTGRTPLPWPEGIKRRGK